MSTLKSLTMVMAVAAGLSACSGPGYGPKEDQGTVIGAVAGGVLGSQMGRGRGSVAGAVVGAVAGGIVGNAIGRSLDDRDRQFAMRAEYDAWERGQPARWQSPHSGRYGEIAPGPLYHRGPQPCREYTHTVYIDGRPQIMRGHACRNPDGTWSGVG